MSLMNDSVLIQANGGIQKVPRCNVQLQLEETSEEQSLDQSSVVSEVGDDNPGQEGKPNHTKTRGRADHIKNLGSKSGKSCNSLGTLPTQDPPPGEEKSSHSSNNPEFRGILPH